MSDVPDAVSGTPDAVSDVPDAVSGTPDAVSPAQHGGGLRLLPDGVSLTWELASSTTLSDGALGLHYRRR